MMRPETKRLLRRVVPVTALALAGACHHQPVMSERIEPVLVPIDRLADELTPPQTAAIAPRVARILLLPDSITIAPGEAYSYEQLRVVAVDSAGTALGRLRVYDVSLDPGAAQLIGARQLRGVHPGQGELWVMFPQALWSGGGDIPRVPLHITVRAPSGGQ